MHADSQMKIAILGAGTMGPGLAQVFAAAGHEVALYSRTTQRLDQALSVLSTNLETFVQHGLLAADSLPDTIARISLTQSLQQAGAGADLVVESIAENLEAKRRLFEELDAICPAGALFTSTTSYLNIFAVVPPRRLPKTVIAHWFAPPHIIPLVEVVKGPQTDGETVEQGRGPAKRRRQGAGRHGEVRARLLREPSLADHRPRGLLSARQRLHDASGSSIWP